MRNYQRVMSSPKLTVLTASRADAVKREQEERTAAKTMTPFTENGSMRVKVSKQANTCSNFAKQDMILTRMSLRRSDEASERERIIDACIKELKK